MPEQRMPKQRLPAAITEIRLSESAFALEVLRRPLSVENGEVVAGEATVEVIDLAARRLRLSLTERASATEGYVLLGTVQNYGITPAAVACLALVRPGCGRGAHGRTLYVFLPDKGPHGNEAVPGWPVMPGEARAFVLDHGTRGRAVADLQGRPPSTYHLAAFSDRACREEHELARLTGEHFAMLME